MLRFKEAEFYTLSNKDQAVEVICVGVGSKFSFFSPAKVKDGEVDVDMTNIWAIANDEPEETVVTQILIPIENFKDGKEN